VDKALFALKGGCNLRFYHRSIRYSELPSRRRPCSAGRYSYGS
jgi:hypothetical protein